MWGLEGRIWPERKAKWFKATRTLRCLLIITLCIILLHILSKTTRVYILLPLSSTRSLNGSTFKLCPKGYCYVFIAASCALGGRPHYHSVSSSPCYSVCMDIVEPQQFRFLTSQIDRPKLKHLCGWKSEWFIACCHATLCQAQVSFVNVTPAVGVGRTRKSVVVCKFPLISPSAMALQVYIVHAGWMDRER